MAEPNIHIRAARAHLQRATKPTFVDDTMRGLLDEIERLRFALRELARFGKRDGKDCWCDAPDPYDDDSVHSPGCRAARAAMSPNETKGVKPQSQNPVAPQRPPTGL